MGRKAHRAIPALGGSATRATCVGVLSCYRCRASGRCGSCTRRCGRRALSGRRRCRSGPFAHGLVGVACLGAIIIAGRSGLRGRCCCGCRGCLAHGLVRIACFRAIIVARRRGLRSWLRRRSGGGCVLADRLVGIAGFGAVVVARGSLSAGRRGAEHRQEQQAGCENEAIHVVSPQDNDQVWRLSLLRAIRPLPLHAYRERLQPGPDTAVMRAGSPAALAEAPRTVAALRTRSCWRP